MGAGSGGPRRRAAVGVSGVGPVSAVMVAAALLVGAGGPASWELSAAERRGRRIPADDPRGTLETLQVVSGTLGEERTVHVVLPPEYREGRGVYPLLIVLDGESLLAPAAATAGFMADALEMPRTIVVGVPNLPGRRTRDLTPAPEGGWTPPLAPEEGPVGGAGAFTSFLADELLPELEARYRTAPFRVVVGHSLGGLLAAWALVERPELFQAALTLDPSLWWNDRATVDDLVSTLRSHPDAGRMRLASVEAVGGFRDDWATLAGAARAEHFGGRVTIEGESHATMPLRGLREGLRVLFADHPPPDPAPGQGALEAVDGHYDALSGRLGFRVEVPAAALRRAGRMALDGNHLEQAREAARRLRTRGEDDAAERLELAVARAGSAGPGRFIPLEVPVERPTAAELAPFVGHWVGRVDHERGIDFRLTVDIEARGDSAKIHARQVGPGGRAFEGERVLIDVPEPGVLEIGQPMRGGVGMEVATLRLVDGGRRLTGSVEFRGFRIPERATPDRVTVDLRRGEEGGGGP